MGALQSGCTILMWRFLQLFCVSFPCWRFDLGRRMIIRAGACPTLWGPGRGTTGGNGRVAGLLMGYIQFAISESFNELPPCPPPVPRFHFRRLWLGFSPLCVAYSDVFYGLEDGMMSASCDTPNVAITRAFRPDAAGWS